MYKTQVIIKGVRKGIIHREEKYKKGKYKKGRLVGIVLLYCIIDMKSFCLL
jgi:hypothetical protein